MNKQEIIKLGKKTYYKKLREKNKEKEKEKFERFFYKQGLKAIKEQEEKEQK